jgi:hypothetical protein
MSERRKKMLSNMIFSAPSEEEQVMMKLVMERICVDMCDFFQKFYNLEGPGAVVYIPDAENVDDSMYYLPSQALMNALKDFNAEEQEGPAEVMKKAIALAESINPNSAALFIIQDKNQMSLVHYKFDNHNDAFMRI